MRTILPPASGTVHWIDENHLKINGTVYEVSDAPRGYYLTKPDGTRYRVFVESLREWSCNCGDARNRGERRCNCKHVRGLRKALVSLPF